MWTKRKRRRRRRTRVRVDDEGRFVDEEEKERTIGGGKGGALLM